MKFTRQLSINLIKRKSLIVKCAHIIVTKSFFVQKSRCGTWTAYKECFRISYFSLYNIIITAKNMCKKYKKNYDCRGKLHAMPNIQTTISSYAFWVFDKFCLILWCFTEVNIFCTATSIYRLHILRILRVLLYRDTIDRVLFYIEMTVMMS